jgi:hypothetical protein
MLPHLPVLVLCVVAIFASGGKTESDSHTRLRRYCEEEGNRAVCESYSATGGWQRANEIMDWVPKTEYWDGQRDALYNCITTGVMMKDPQLGPEGDREQKIRAFIRFVVSISARPPTDDRRYVQERNMIVGIWVGKNSDGEAPDYGVDFKCFRALTYELLFCTDDISGDSVNCPYDSSGSGR